MDTGTIIFIVIGVLTFGGLAIHEVRTWNKPGKVITGTPGHDNAVLNETALRNNGGVGTGGMFTPPGG
jgi:hypothetical protein